MALCGMYYRGHSHVAGVACRYRKHRHGWADWAGQEHFGKHDRWKRVGNLSRRPGAFPDVGRLRLGDLGLGAC